jgi:transmembrane sensor
MAPDELAREARAWVSRLTSGEATASDVARFNRWCEASPAHRHAFAEAKLLWQVMRPAAEQSMTRADAARSAASQQPETSMLGRRAFFGGAMAASLVGATTLAIRPPLDLWPSLTEITSDYRTAKGESRLIRLADASIELNTQTSISLRPIAGDVDLIELVSGEAAIVVNPDSRRSFAVLAGGGRTTGRNAAFNVRHIGSSGCVSCSTGEVVVVRDGEQVTLQPRQQISYDSRGLQPVVTVDPAVVSAWQQGVLVFRSDPLSRVIDEVNRYRSGRIVLVNEELGRRQVFASFRIDRIEDVVPRLQAVFGMRVRSLPGGIVLLS